MSASSINQGSGSGSGSLGSEQNSSSSNNSSLEDSGSPYGSISQGSQDNKVNTDAYNESDSLVREFIDNTGNAILHPFTTTILVIIALIIYIKNSVSPDPYNPTSGIENIIWILLTIVLVVNILYYYFDISFRKFVTNTYDFILDIFKSIKDFLFTLFGLDQLANEESNGSPEETNSSPIETEEVFHIPGNKYTYTEADGLCKAFGARLANYDEIENAYSKGGEWCSYGWSEGQMAYFPTQKDTFNQLQKYPEQKNNCGRPGVNGGYMANPYIKFGVNCYGMKPEMKNGDEKYMKASETRVHKRNNTNNGNNSQNVDNVIVASFNTKDWNQYQRM